MTSTLRPYLELKHCEQNGLPTTGFAAELDEIVSAIVDACCAALYARLHTVHKEFGTYATRYDAPATYSPDIELPLPFADAIQNFCVFNPRGMLKNYLCIPIHPEGTQNEGRSSQTWNSHKYEASKQILKDLGIPMKSIDHTKIKPGTAWWTYRPSVVCGTFDLRCIFPPSNYSDHSALVASMFLVKKENEEADSLIEFLNDDSNYPKRMRQVAADFQLRAFAAFCHAPSVEWAWY